LRGQFTSKEKVTMRAAQTTNKLRTLKYTGAPNFTWDRFSQELMRLYSELENDKVPVEGRVQVQELFGRTTQERTKWLAIDTYSQNGYLQEDLQGLLTAVGTRLALSGMGNIEFSQTLSKRQIKMAKQKKKAEKGSGGSQASAPKKPPGSGFV
jgi:hypothetical protein